ncbi:MAG: endolytic transglycosylase MltG [Candidatus Dadabacteria bacterium]|nr:MAG: endolytic transglycosylase MltG [Candidatus Dadabacteria bacterium]
MNGVKVFIALCRILGWITIALMPLAILGGIAYYGLKGYLFEPLEPGSKKKVIIEIKPGTGFKAAAKLLERKGIVKVWWSLDLLSRISGNNTIEAGEYNFSPSMSPEEVLKALVEGKIYKRTVLFREGESIRVLGSLVEKAGLVSKEEFNKVLYDPKIIKLAGLGAGSFEGYLFPDTYHFTKPITPKQIIWTMLEKGEKVWTPAFQRRADELRMTRHEILTLASMIEKESGNKDEQPLISSVFHNRLAKGMKLESDPTAVYAIPGFSGKILKKHLKVSTPYNTYIIYGLPPGPICNPGLSAIKAALYPADTTYLYFVADGRGGHIFSSTLAEHKRAVEFYRRRRR